MGNYNFELDLDSVNTMSIINSWIKDGAKILEIGSANGRLTKHLATVKQCRMTIVEIDEAAGSEAARYAENSYVGTKQGDVNNLYWFDEAKKYDYIIFSDVLEHLSDPQGVLNRCKKMLEPKGMLLVSIPNIAHNSVLVDLLNDKFVYDSVGLLDRTHIHFFTYHTFVDMIGQLGLSIVKQQPVYSQVGWNEIKNSFDDVSYEVEKALRARKSGSVYQYVFCIQRAEEVQKSLTYEEIEPMPDNFREEETSCFVWRVEKKQSESVVSEEQPAARVSFVYANDSTEKTFRYHIGMSINKVRIDFLESACIIKINSLLVKEAGKAATRASVLCHNGMGNIADVYYFQCEDPWVEIDLSGFTDSENYGVEVEYVEASFEILDNRMGDFHKEIYRKLFQNVKESFVSQTEVQELEKKILGMDDKILAMKQEADNYANHLLGDIKSLQDEVVTSHKVHAAYVADMEKVNSENAAYVAHLEADISKQAEYIARLEADTSKQAEYIEHLEKDISELKEFVEKKKKWIKNRFRK